MSRTVQIRRLLRRLTPPAAAVVAVAVFVSLGFWQLDRASQKIALQKLFDEGAHYAPLVEGMAVTEYQRIRTSGRFLTEHQFLIDNMIAGGRVGYFVITPFEYAPDEPLLLVNRGWIGKTGSPGTKPDLALPDDRIEIRGRVGHLPRVAIRPGNALQDAGDWPQLAIYPTLPELAAALGQDVLPYVLLLDPDPSQPLLRDWQPNVPGPMMHYGYAFQWFAMAAAVIAIVIWQLRKRVTSGNG